MLRAFGASRQARGLPLEVSAEDHMDDGSPIRLHVQINLSQVSVQGQWGGLWPLGCDQLLMATPFFLVGRAAQCLTSVVPGLRCSAISTPRGP